MPIVAESKFWQKKVLENWILKTEGSFKCKEIKENPGKPTKTGPIL